MLSLLIALPNNTMLLVAGVRSRFKDVDSLVAFLKKQPFAAQAFDADSVFRELLVFAHYHAIKAFGEGTNRARSLPAEMLLWAAGTSKIDRALERVGVRHPSQAVIAADCSEQEGKELLRQLGERDDSLLELTPAKADRLLAGVDKSLRERYSVEELLLERAAMLSAQA